MRMEGLRMLGQVITLEIALDANSKGDFSSRLVSLRSDPQVSVDIEAIGYSDRTEQLAEWLHTKFTLQE